MTQTLLTILLTVIIIPLPLIIIAAFVNRNELSQRGIRRAASDLCMSIATAGISMFIACVTRPLFFLNRIKNKHHKKATQPILMVHGLYHNDMAWIFIKPRLKKAGFLNLNTWSYNSFTSSYPELVLELRKHILKLYSENNNKKILLIGHSLGGLLIQGAVTDSNIADCVTKIITLGTPFRGSILASAALGRLGQSLHPQSSLFLKHESSPSTHIKKTAIMSPVDEMVLPWSNLKPYDQDWQIKHCPAMGHVAMLYSSKVVQMIESIIAH